MSTKGKYKTRQQEELLGYLETVPGDHITVNDICAHFKSKGASIGQTTVYRHLERLVEEGLVNKYIIDGNSAACFEYINQGRKQCGEVCFHCKCEKCGKLIHMHCEEFLAIQEHLREHHNFILDPLRTVFYGHCEECSSERNEPKDSKDR